MKGLIESDWMRC